MKEDIEQKFKHLRAVVESKQFLGKEGIMNEVPFFIFPYSPKEENQVQELSQLLFSTLRKNGASILEINLYDLCADLIKERGYWDKLISKESALKKKQLKDQIQNLTQVDSKIVPAIAQKIAGPTRFADSLYHRGWSGLPFYPLSQPSQQSAEGSQRVSHCHVLSRGIHLHRRSRAILGPFWHPQRG